MEKNTKIFFGLFFMALMGIFLNFVSAEGNYSDSGGNYAIYGLIAGNYSVSADKVGYVGETNDSVPVYEGQNTPNVNFVLQIEGSISGKVYLLYNGSYWPLYYARVTARNGTEEVSSDTTGWGDGSYNITELKAGTYNVTAECPWACYANVNGSLITITNNGYIIGQIKYDINVIAGQDTSNVDFNLTTSTCNGTVSGYVYDVNGSPISGAYLWFYSDNYYASTTTDENGSYVVSLMNDTYYFYVYKSYLVNEKWVYMEAYKPEINVTCDSTYNVNFKAASVSGKITDTSSNPINNSYVYGGANWYDFGYGSGETYTNSSGDYLLKILLPSNGSYTIRIYVKAYKEMFLENTSSNINITEGQNTPNVDIILSSGGGCIYGNITSNYGQPIYAYVQIKNGTYSRTLYTNDYGFYNTSSYFEYGIPAGTYNVTAYYSSYCKNINQTKTVEVIAGQCSNANFTLTLPGKGSISGKVTDTNGTPIEAAYVSAWLSSCPVVGAGGQAENCTNGVDDDSDGAIDCSDADCPCPSGQTCNQTTHVCYTPASSVSENCTNGVDDDSDGAIDCCDSNCSNDIACLLDFGSVHAGDYSERVITTNGVLCSDANNNSKCECETELCYNITNISHIFSNMSSSNATLLNTNFNVTNISSLPVLSYTPINSTIMLSVPSAQQAGVYTGSLEVDLMFNDVNNTIVKTCLTTKVNVTLPICSDGTAYNQCSAEKPKYCVNGNLIDNCSICGCSSGYTCNATSGSCYIPSGGCTICISPSNIVGKVMYTDGTPVANKNISVFVDGVYKNNTTTGDNGVYSYASNICSNGSLINVSVYINSQSYSNSTILGCGEQKELNIIVTTCNDGTAYGQCSSTKPKMCVNGVLVDNCSACGCSSEGQLCNATSGLCYFQTCSDGTAYGQCSSTKPKMCVNGVLTDNCSVCGCSAGQSCQSNGLCIPVSGYSVFVSPGYKISYPGEVFNVSVSASGANISGVDFVLSYNPEVLKFRGMQNGTLLKSVADMFPPISYLSIAQMNESNGKIQFLGALTGNGNAVLPSGDVLIVTFESIKGGRSNLTLTGSDATPKILRITNAAANRTPASDVAITSGSVFVKTADVWVEAPSCTKNNTFYVDVMVNTSVNISGFDLLLTYNSSVLTPVADSCTAGSFLTNAGSILNSPGNNCSGNPIKFSSSLLSGQTTSGTGVLFRVMFNATNDGISIFDLSGTSSYAEILVFNGSPVTGVNITDGRTVFDTTNPSVSITSPSNGAYVGGIIAINGIVSDANFVVISVKVDGTQIATSLPASLNTTTYSDGLHNLSIFATDCAGNSNTATISVNIDNTPPQIINVSASSSGSDSEIISWSTNENANSTVYYGTNQSNLANTAVNSNLNTSHSITLTGLNNTITYYYKVSSCDAVGNCNTSQIYSFIAKRPIGEACSSGSECLSGNCLCGVCRDAEWACIYRECETCKSYEYCAADHKCHYSSGGGGGGSEVPIITPPAIALEITTDITSTTYAGDNFTVTITSNGIPVAGAKVEYANSTKYTSATGKVVFTAVEGTHEIKASAFNYLPKTLPVTIIKKPVILPQLDIFVDPESPANGTEFTVTVKSNNVPVENVKVTYVDNTKYTDSLGKVVFTAVVGRNLISASKENYSGTQRFLEVKAPEVEKKKLNALITPSNLTEGDEFTVTVTSEGKPAVGVSVSYSGVTKTTDADGKVKFTAVKGTQQVSLSGEGYESSVVYVVAKEKPVVQPYDWTPILLGLLVLVILALLAWWFLKGKGGVEINKSREGDNVTVSVRNTGKEDLMNCVVEDVIPPDAKVDLRSLGAEIKDGKIVWDVGVIASGEEKILEYRIETSAETLPKARIVWDKGEKVSN